MENNTPPPSQPPGSQKPGGPGMKMSRNLISWVILFGMAILLVTLLSSTLDPPAQISITKFDTLVKNKEIKSLVIKEGGVIEGQRTRQREGEPPGTGLRFSVTFPTEAIDGPFLDKMVQAVRDQGGEVTYEKPNQFLLVLVSLLPWILFFGLIWFVIYRQIRGAGATGGMLGGFGRSRHRVSVKEHTNVTFDDVAGIIEAKDEVQEIIEFLKAPKKFQRLGGRIPRGVLLVGPPGCGKTLLAKAIAGEADVPFFSISGSDFVEMFVGVGASRVRDLFKQAKENSPCILFLDEIDAVGRRRGTSFGGGGHDEREQTLNAILVEMDGFDSNTQIIVVAATNRADVLDPALVRPGRFDRQVFVPYPDLQGRYEILKVHLRKIKLGPTIDVRRSARGTPMFTGAELAALVNEAALIATMAGKEFVEQEDLEEARDKVRWGRAKKSAVVDERDRRLTAYHEAGHAVVQALEKHADPLHKVSIIPRGQAGGATFALPERDRTVYTKNYLLAIIHVALAGRIAEELFFNEISSGAASDIRQATEIARNMVREWGMGETVGFVYYGDDDAKPGMFELGGRTYSDKTAEAIDHEVKRIVDTAYAGVKRLITENRDKVDAVAKALLKHETITGEETNALIRGESIERATVSDLLDGADATPRENVGKARPVEFDPKRKPDLGEGTLPQLS